MSRVCVCVFQQDRSKVNSPESSFELIEGCICQLFKCSVFNWRRAINIEFFSSFSSMRNTLTLYLVLSARLFMLVDKTGFDFILFIDRFYCGSLEVDCTHKSIYVVSC